MSFVGPFLEMLLTGRVESYGAWEIGETLVSLVLVFWWYHVDKAEHGYKAGPLMNGGMLLVLAVAMPIYLVRSRGWKRGAIAIAVAAAIFVVLLGLGEAGEWLAKDSAPATTSTSARKIPTGTSSMPSSQLRICGFVTLRRAASAASPPAAARA